MNGKTAKLLRKVSWCATIDTRDQVYALNKRIWNATPRPQRASLRERAEAMVEAHN